MPEAEKESRRETIKQDDEQRTQMERVNPRPKPMQHELRCYFGFRNG